ncbi:MAG: hypothetical protein H7A25_10270 [Leptospiraceae bacterium]|nr:hypothetical protein [Leptospiraceae bacterium]MCP5500277.1 hypothetical protein [Leptospiraceae bacterium]
MSYRLLFSFYLSLLFHAIFIVFMISPKISNQKLICGRDFPVQKVEELNFDVSFEVPKDLFHFKESKQESEKETKDKTEAKPGKETSKEKTEEEKNKEEFREKLAEKYSKGKWKDLVKSLKETEGMRESFDNTFKDLLPGSKVGNSYIYRYRHYEDMIVKEVLPTLHNLEKKFTDELQIAEKEFEEHKERNEIIDEFRQGEEADFFKMEKNSEPSELVTKPVLNMPKEERMKYFDKTLPLPKEKQMQDFMERFSGFDPDKGDLAMLYRDLYYENLQRLAYTFSSDSSYFTIDYFEENLNKEDYLKNAMSLTSELKGTKTATEILFTLENIYEIQSRAFAQYFQFYDRYKSFSPSMKKELRYETIRRVIEKYKPIIEAKNYHNYQDVKKEYFRKRVEILDYLMQTSPDSYRKKDALFEKGRILWEEGAESNNPKYQEEAIKTWKNIISSTNTGDFLYENSYSQLDKQIKKFVSAKNIQEKNNIKNSINFILNSRLFDTLNQKRQREDRILWKQK